MEAMKSSSDPTTRGLVAEPVLSAGSGPTVALILFATRSPALRSMETSSTELTPAAAMTPSFSRFAIPESMDAPRSLPN